MGGVCAGFFTGILPCKNILLAQGSFDISGKNNPPIMGNSHLELNGK